MKDRLYIDKKLKEIGVLLDNKCIELKEQLDDFVKEENIKTYVRDLIYKYSFKHEYLRIPVMFYIKQLHPRIAVRNAQKVTTLNKIEKDIIVKHMFGATVAQPRYKESWIVTCVDKYWAVREATLPWQHKWKNRKILRLKIP